MSGVYAGIFNDVLAFARKMIAPAGAQTGRGRIQYWTALALLRGIMSSPVAGIEMLNARMENLQSLLRDDSAGTAEGPELFENPVHDTEFGFESDTSPTQVVERGDWSSQQKDKMREFARNLRQISNFDHDYKLASAEMILEDWLRKGFNAVVFCRYIATADYVGEQLLATMKKKFPKLDLQVITSEQPDEVRKQRIDEMAKSTLRVLVATDCLSEGINLQDSFTVDLHYDLPWNPNRLEHL